MRGLFVLLEMEVEHRAPGTHCWCTLPSGTVVSLRRCLGEPHELSIAPPRPDADAEPPSDDNAEQRMLLERMGCTQWEPIATSMHTPTASREDRMMLPDAELAAAMATLRFVLPNGPAQTFGPGAESTSIHCTVFVARTALPAADLRQGDLLLWTLSVLSERKRRLIRGSTEAVSQEHFPDLVQRQVLQWLASSWGQDSESVRRYLTNRTVLRGRRENSRLYRVRPYRSPVSQPIRAASDTAALFELLAQVGGRLPSTREGAS